MAEQDFSSNLVVKTGSSDPVYVVGGSLTVTNPTTAPTPSASSTAGTGLSAFRSAAVTNAGVSIKAAAGKIHGYSFSNPGSAACYVNLYNQTAVTVGTTNPILQVLVPAGQTVNKDVSLGIQCATGIMVAVTDASAPDSVVAAATLPVVNVQFI